jgi:hypothetical protein
MSTDLRRRNVLQGLFAAGVALKFSGLSLPLPAQWENNGQVARRFRVS